MRIYRVILSFILATTLFTACERKELEDPYQFLAYVPVLIDWSQSNLESTGIDRIANVTIAFYPKDGGTPIIKVSDELSYNLVSVPIGEYSVLIYNDIATNIRNVTFENTNSYSDICTHITEDFNTTISFYDQDEPTHLALDHGRLATYYIDSFTIDSDMVDYTRSVSFEDYIQIDQSRSDNDSDIFPSYTMLELPTIASLSSTASKSVTRSLESLIDISPQPQTTAMSITVNVENLDNAVYNNSLYSFTAILQGTAHGSYLTSDNEFSLSDQDLIYYIEIEDYEFDDNGVDGSVTFDINTFGRIEEDEEYSISFRIVQLSGDLYEMDCDITDDILNAVDDVNIEIDLTDDSETIYLNPYNGVVFDVTDWDNSETVYL